MMELPKLQCKIVEIDAKGNKKKKKKKKKKKRNS